MTTTEESTESGVSKLSWEELRIQRIEAAIKVLANKALREEDELDVTDLLAGFDDTHVIELGHPERPVLMRTVDEIINRNRYDAVTEGRDAMIKAINAALQATRELFEAIQSVYPNDPSTDRQEGAEALLNKALGAMLMDATDTLECLDMRFDSDAKSA